MATGSSARNRVVVHTGWPHRADAAEAAREAAFRRLNALIVESGPDVGDGLVGDGLDSARSSFELRSVDDEQATLVYDSTIDDRLLEGVRSSGRSVRQLSFAARDVVLEIEVSEGARHLVGQVVPPQPAIMEIRHRRGCTHVATDELGCFHLPALPEGPVSLRCSPGRPGANSVATSWIAL